MDETVKKAAEDLVSNLAGNAGIEIDPAKLVELAEKAAGYIGDLIGAHAWRDAKAAGEARAAEVHTEADAEKAQRNR